MAFEQTQNSERAIQPQGVELARLSVSNSEMSVFQAGYKSGTGVDIVDREMELFGNGFSFDQVANPYGKSDFVAWDPTEQYQGIRKPALGTDIVRVAGPLMEDHPFRGRELGTIARDIPEEKFQQAYNAFPEIKDALSPEGSNRLMKAVIANELNNYGPDDVIQDKLAKLTGGIGESGMTLGYSQITPVGVRAMAKELEDQVNRHERANNPLAKYLNADNKAITRALEDPKEAPLLVAANIAHNIRMYRNNGVVINEGTLGYGFNPDVSFRHDDKKHEHPLTPKEAKHLKSAGVSVDKAILPTGAVLGKSPHFANIEQWLSAIASE